MDRFGRGIVIPWLFQIPTQGTYFSIWSKEKGGTTNRPMAPDQVHLAMKSWTIASTKCQSLPYSFSARFYRVPNDAPEQWQSGLSTLSPLAIVSPFLAQSCFRPPCCLCSTLHERILQTTWKSYIWLKTTNYSPVFILTVTITTNSSRIGCAYIFCHEILFEETVANHCKYFEQLIFIHLTPTASPLTWLKTIHFISYPSWSSFVISFTSLLIFICQAPKR